MKFSPILAASALALLIAAPGAKAAEEFVSISKVNGNTLAVPITFDFNTSDPLATSTPDGVLFTLQNVTGATAPIYNIYFYDNDGGTSYSGLGVGGNGGFFTLDSGNQFTSGVNGHGVAILDNPLANGVYYVGGGQTVLSLTAVPEPAVWAMMIVGAGMIGAGLRLSREKRGLAVAV